MKTSNLWPAGVGLSLDDAHGLNRAHQAVSDSHRGARGTRRLDVGEMARTVVAVSELMAERPKIVEMDLNRVFVQRDGVSLADRRILTE